MSRFMTEAEHAARTMERQGLGEQVPRVLERDIKGPVLDALVKHPKVAFAWRANSGEFKIMDLYGTRWIKVNFTGCSDLLFMTTSGRFGACEVKREGQDPSAAQQSFLDRVNEHGGIGFVARSSADVYAQHLA